jgi:hypothetical protein
MGMSQMTGIKDQESEGCGQDKGSVCARESGCPVCLKENKTRHPFARVHTRCISILLVGAFFMYALSAHAEACYTQDQFDADRGLRMHSDVEVVMLTCRYATNGEDLRKTYAQFLKKNSAQIRKWENTIAVTFASTGGSRNEVIDNFRTRLANEKAGQAAQMRAKPFCAQWANFVPFVTNLTPPQVLEYIRAPDSARPTKRPPC